MDQSEPLRKHLQKILDWEDAHTSFDSAIKGIPADARGIQPTGLPYSLWQVLEHMRLCQYDILDFCRNPNYKEPNFGEFWPKRTDPPTEKAWDESIATFRKDRESLKEFAADSNIDLYSKIPHGDGQTYLRELLLVADHNAYHVADLIAIRRLLGIWNR